MEYENHFVNEPKPVPSSEKSLPCFDCSICLDFAKDPIVTLCGHLYCWPCIYKWLSFHTNSGDTPLCPVCKSEISDTTVIPLYGRGKTFSDEDPSGKLPPRPRAGATLPTAPNPTQHLTYRNSHQTPLSHAVRPVPMYGSDPSVWMYGEMVYDRVFGNSEGLYSFPNSYHMAGRSSARLRRQEMEVHKSLNRLTIFLYCCLLLCLLLF